MLQKLPASSPHKKEWDARVEAYAAANPDAYVVDLPSAVRRVANRETMLDAVRAVESAANPASAVPVSTANAETALGPETYVVRAPKQIVAVAGTESQVRAQVDAASLRFPLLAKSMRADGSSDSHKVAIIHDEDGLACVARGTVPGLKPPCVIQEYVNHGGCLFKVYVVGDDVTMTRRKSLPDLRGARRASRRRKAAAEKAAAELAAARGEGPAASRDPRGLKPRVSGSVAGGAKDDTADVDGDVDDSEEDWDDDGPGAGGYGPPKLMEPSDAIMQMIAPFCDSGENPPPNEKKKGKKKKKKKESSKSKTGSRTSKSKSKATAKSYAMTPSQRYGAEYGAEYGASVAGGGGGGSAPAKALTSTPSRPELEFASSYQQRDASLEEAVRQSAIAEDAARRMREAVAAQIERDSGDGIGGPLNFVGGGDAGPRVGGSYLETGTTACIRQMMRCLASPLDALAGDNSSPAMGTNYTYSGGYGIGAGLDDPQPRMAKSKGVFEYISVPNVSGKSGARRGEGVSGVNGDDDPQDEQKSLLQGTGYNSNW